MNIIIILFLFIFSFSILKCEDNYVFPLHTININYTESELKQDYLLKIYSNQIYANFIIGSNQEEIKGLVNMSQMGFFIYENAYDCNSSKSFNHSNTTKSFYRKNYEEGYLANDTLCLVPYDTKIDINNLNIRKCNNFEKVEFSILKSKQRYIENNIYDKYAIIGLQQNDNQDALIMPMFIKSLKNTDMINSHTYSFQFYNNTKSGENEGYLLIGEEELDLDHGFLKRTLSNSKNGQTFWNLLFKNIIVGINNSYNNSYDNHLRFFDIKYAQIIGDLSYFIGIKNYQSYIRSVFFEPLLIKNICKYQNISTNDDYGTYVCDSKSELFIQKYKNEFPKIYFEHAELNTTFILDQYDLFTYNNIDKTDTKIYFLVFFQNKDDPYVSPEAPSRQVIKRWKLGIPFLKKYKLYFNNEDRIISYYEKFIDHTKGDGDNDDNNNTNLEVYSTDYTWLKIGIIIFLLIIFFILGILFHKNIIRLPRKKKANELEDDYEYSVNPNDFDDKKASLNNYEIAN